MQTTTEKSILGVFCPEVIGTSNEAAHLRVVEIFASIKKYNLHLFWSKSRREFFIVPPRALRCSSSSIERRRGERGILITAHTGRESIIHGVEMQHVHRLISAYRKGYFVLGDEAEWWSRYHRDYGRVDPDAGYVHSDESCPSGFEAGAVDGVTFDWHREGFGYEVIRVKSSGKVSRYNRRHHGCHSAVSVYGEEWFESRRLVESYGPIEEVSTEVTLYSEREFTSHRVKHGEYMDTALSGGLSDDELEKDAGSEALSHWDRRFHSARRRWMYRPNGARARYLAGIAHFDDLYHLREEAREASEVELQLWDEAAEARHEAAQQRLARYNKLKRRVKRLSPVERLIYEELGGQLRLLADDLMYMSQVRDCINRELTGRSELEDGVHEGDPMHYEDED